MDDATRLRLTEWGEAYWQNLAQNKPPRFWWYGWPRWAKPIFIGGDERLRKTIVIGPLVIALWYCHCEHCNDERARTLAIVDDLTTTRPRRRLRAGADPVA